MANGIEGILEVLARRIRMALHSRFERAFTVPIDYRAAMVYTAFQAVPCGRAGFSNSASSRRAVTVLGIEKGQ